MTTWRSGKPFGIRVRSPVNADADYRRGIASAAEINIETLIERLDREANANGSVTLGNRSLVTSPNADRSRDSIVSRN